MQGNHIIKLLEERGVGQLSESEMAALAAHAADCHECMRAYQAARLSSVLIRARASETVEPSPFFKTRVMAAIREKQLSPEPPALVRMWRAAGALVSAMAMLVVILVGLTLFGYGPGPQIQTAEAAQNIFSPEYVVFEPDDAASESLPYDLVLATMYDSEETDGSYR
jgi:hypothetical protein